MDYEKLAVAIKLCGSTPKVDKCPQCPYWASGDMNNCIPRVTADAATAITDLLARAEAAEARAEKAERERDAAVELIGWIYYEACVSVEHDMRQHLDWFKNKIEQWRKKKEE